jgi:hypothetical protein
MAEADELATILRALPGLSAEEVRQVAAALPRSVTEWKDSELVGFKLLVEHHPELTTELVGTYYVYRLFDPVISRRHPTYAAHVFTVDPWRGPPYVWRARAEGVESSHGTRDEAKAAADERLRAGRVAL